MDNLAKFFSQLITQGISIHVFIQKDVQMYREDATGL